MRLLDDEFMSAAFSEKTNLFDKSVKLDVVAEDIFKTEYNIEIQRADSGAGARRIRYHQAMLDNHTLSKGGTFKDLPNLYIIFILEHDIFERGLPVYRVYKTLNIQDDFGNNLPFDDDCNIMYINGEYKGDDPLGKLMHDFSTSNADEMFYKELADRMRFLKQDEEGIEMASKIVEEYGDIRAAEALQQGIQQGTQQKAIETARNLKTKDVDINISAECTGLSVEEVQKL